MKVGTYLQNCKLAMEDEVFRVRRYLSSLGLQGLRVAAMGVAPRYSGDESSAENLLNHIIANASSTYLKTLQDITRKQALEKENEQLQKTVERKRKRAMAQYERRQAIRIDETVNDLQNDTSKYLELPSEAEVRECYREFYERTGTAAIEDVVCGVCGGEVNKRNDRVKMMEIVNLPNAHRLQPKQQVDAYELVEGLLLEDAGVVHKTDGRIVVNVCSSCERELKKNSPLPPPHSLANNLWVGKVPLELDCLTLPEQMLISRLFPRVFVFKLYNKSNRQQNPSTLQRGMRGTVCTFENDIKGIADMIKGKLMPKPLSILPEIITITFIGKGKVPIDKLRKLFRVRRQVVYRALYWLKTHNKKYYGDIIIDEPSLANLPEDDIPIEVSAIIRQSTDEGLVDDENSGYVPDNDGE